MSNAPDPRPLLALAEAKVPRYTSYPTAAQFGPLAEDMYRDWLARDVRRGDPLSLYLHVPFCKDLCWYCACHTTATRSALRIAAYQAALEREIELLAAAVPADHGGIAHLHFGGGTPSILGAEGLRRLLTLLRHRFGLRAGAEVAIELDPRLLDATLAEALGAMGFTRASLGVQDIAPEIQARIGRPQPAALVEIAVQRLRAAGLRGLNIDLIYGLPGQTESHVEASARFAAALDVDRLAVFGYAHVAWMKPHQKAIDAALLPDAAARLRQAEVAEAVLRQAGYLALGLDHFARPGDALARAAAAGRLRRNFQGYTTDNAPVLLGLGASAIGALRQGHAQNQPEERRYLAAIAEDRLPVIRGLATTADDRRRAGLIERLMCDFALDLRGVEPAILAPALPRLAALQEGGLLRLTPDRLEMTEAGRRFVRQAAVCFDAYFGASAGRHSAAV